MRIIYLFSVILFAFFGCSDDPPAATNTGGGGGLIDGGGGGGGGGGNVTIQVQGQADGQGNYLFSIKPSVNINLASVKASVPAQQYEETIAVNSQFTAGQFEGCLQYPANVIQQGMQFTFVFTGTTVQGNANFTATTNYTIP